MRFDRTNLLQTAQAILKLNQYAREKYETPEKLVSYMEGMAYQELANGAAYVGTMGFYLTAYKHPAGDIGILATVAPWLIK